MPRLFEVAPRIAPSTPSLAQREPQLAIDPIGAQDRLQLALEGLDAELVIIDCPPSLGLLTVNGLFAADAAVIVTEPGAWATDGVDQILRNVGRIAERRRGAPSVAGIVVNRLARTRDARYWDEQLMDDYGTLTLPAGCTACCRGRGLRPVAATPFARRPFGCRRSGGRVRDHPAAAGARHGRWAGRRVDETVVLSGSVAEAAHTHHTDDDRDADGDVRPATVAVSTQGSSTRRAPPPSTRCSVGSLSATSSNPR